VGSSPDTSSSRAIAAVWFVVAIVIVVRALVAFKLPLTGDEAYYWEWSRHLAWGYVDHPPMVAWTIAAFAFLGQTPGVVRLGFVLCGLVASIAIAGCAIELSGDRRAGAVAALALTLAPLSSLMFASASPDGPYLMFWTLALWFGARAFKRDDLVDWALLGAFVAGTLRSRIFGFALLAGIVAYACTPGVRRVWRRGMPLALLICALVFAPFVAWNATHDWATFAFAIVHRHQESHSFEPGRVVALLLTQLAAYSPGIFVAIVICVFRSRSAYLAWTAIPMLVLMTALALIEKVEVYWIFGAVASLCAMLGIAFVQLSPRLKTIWATLCVVPGAILVPLILAVSFAPIPIYRFVEHGSTARLRNGGPFEIMTYAPLAKDAAGLAQKNDAVVMTDGYGFSSVMDFDAGIVPVVIGYNWQGRESRAWFPDSQRPARALFVDKEPLDSRPDIAKHLHRACTRVVDGGIREYGFGGTTPRAYYFTWCEGLGPESLAILRWEREPVPARARGDA
jgi:hypothetical protein